MKTSIKKLVLFAVVLILSKNSFAQLSGNYIIGSGETFSTLEAAVDQLNLVGADGLVEFEIKAGTYSDNCTIDPLVSYSEGDSVAIKPVAGDVVKFNHSNTSTNNFVIKLDGASHVSVSGLNFLGANATYCNMIKLTNGASFNTIKENYFEAPDGGVTNEAVIIFDNASGKNEHNNNYFNNTIIGGSVGIKLTGDAAVHQGPSYVAGNSITGSTYSYGLKMEYINGGEVKENYVEGEVYLRIDSSFNVIDNHFESEASTNHCLRIFEHDNTVPKGPLTIANNVLIGINNTWACHIEASKNFKFYHNTLINNTETGPQTLYIGTVSDAEVINNVIVNKGIYQPIHYANFGINVTVDYNTYYSLSGEVGYMVLTKYSSLADWKSGTGLDANSTFVLPQFLGPDEYRYRCKSGADLQSTILFPGMMFDKDEFPRLTVPVWKGAYNAVASDSITVDGFVADGLDTLRNGIVKIYGDMTSKALLDSIGMSSIDANGYFKFDKVPYLREYWVKVIPDRVLAPDYVTCYQDTSLRWDETDPIVVTDSCDGQQILLVPRKLADMGTGPNSISGTITDISGTGKTFGTDPIPGLDVVLDRIPPSKTVAFTTTDENGYYEFGDLPDGNYVVSIDYEGLHSDTIYDINIAGGTEREYLDYCVDRNDRIQGCASGVNTEEVMINSTTIFPNPFQNEITIQTDLESFDLLIFNMEGKIVSSQNNLSSNHIINTANLSPGVYLLEVISNGVSKKTSVVKY